LHIGNAVNTGLKLKSKESGAGRFTDFLLPPLTFSEYLAFIKKEDTLIIAFNISVTVFLYGNREHSLWVATII
jgi:predicted AAA+ superfamily ATPase